VWKKATTQSSQLASESSTNSTGRVHQLMARLETLRTEQDQIITELKEMLDSASLSSSATTVSQPSTAKDEQPADIQ